MIGVGEIFVAGDRIPAEAALAHAGLVPLSLGPKEGLALLNGTQFSTATALAELFEAENLYRTALVTGALSTDVRKVRMRHLIGVSICCAVIVDRSRRRTLCEISWRVPQSAHRISSATNGCRTRIACVVNLK